MCDGLLKAIFLSNIFCASLKKLPYRHRILQNQSFMETLWKEFSFKFNFNFSEFNFFEVKDCSCWRLHLCHVQHDRCQFICMVFFYMWICLLLLIRYHRFNVRLSRIDIIHSMSGTQIPFRTGKENYFSSRMSPIT